MCQTQINTKFLYRGSPSYVHFGTWKNLCYMKFMLKELYCPTNAKIPHLHIRKPKTVVAETMLVIFV